MSYAALKDFFCTLRETPRPVPLRDMPCSSFGHAWRDMLNCALLQRDTIRQSGRCLHSLSVFTKRLFFEIIHCLESKLNYFAGHVKNRQSRFVFDQKIYHNHCVHQ